MQRAGMMAGLARRAARVRALLLLLALAGAALALPARAATCTVGAQAVAFGGYDALNAAPSDTGPAYVTVNCSNFLPTTVMVRVNLSRGSAASYLPRRMQGPMGETLAYNLYADAARTQAWGDGTGGTVWKQDTIAVDTCWFIFFCAGDASYPVFGRVPPLQDVRVGAYSDAIQVEVVF
jgi:spore coat protein U-like protein